jgi:hypothetical protein
MATLGRRSHDTRPPSPLPPPTGPPPAPPDVFSDETPRAPSRIPSDEGTPAPQQTRLAMFTEKLSSGTSSLARGPAQLFSHNNNSHSRADSQLRENAGSPAPAMAPSTSGGASYLSVHTSPSKVRGRVSGGAWALFFPFVLCPCCVPPSRMCSIHQIPLRLFSKFRPLNLF